MNTEASCNSRRLLAEAGSSDTRDWKDRYSSQNMIPWESSMALVLFMIVLALASVTALIWARRRSGKRQLERHSLSVEQLQSLMASGQKVFLFDVRQPLDLLAYPELIPGAKRIPPEDVLKTPSLLPRDEDIVVYCTCPGDNTSRIVLRRALAVGFTRVKFLTGGLAAWKKKGYSVEPYTESFRLSTSTVTPAAGSSSNTR
jgi:rhodanese-related sulfurtransferase